jgi:CubicO group peptidase (beta-lactamase class C family)
LALNRTITTTLRLVAFSLSVPPQSAQDDTVTKLEKLIPDLMKEADVPGVSIALTENARIVWVGSFGVKNAETHEPVDDRGRPEVTRVEPKQFISHRDGGAARSTLDTRLGPQTSRN